MKKKIPVVEVTVIDDEDPVMIHLNRDIGSQLYEGMLISQRTQILLNIENCFQEIIDRQSVGTNNRLAKDIWFMLRDLASINDVLTYNTEIKDHLMVDELLGTMKFNSKKGRKKNG